MAACVHPPIPDSMDHSSGRTDEPISIMDLSVKGTVSSGCSGRKQNASSNQVVRRTKRDHRVGIVIACCCMLCSVWRPRT